MHTSDPGEQLSKIRNHRNKPSNNNNQPKWDCAIVKPNLIAKHRNKSKHKCKCCLVPHTFGVVKKADFFACLLNKISSVSGVQLLRS